MGKKERSKWKWIIEKMIVGLEGGWERWDYGMFRNEWLKLNKEKGNNEWEKPRKSEIYLKIEFEIYMIEEREEYTLNNTNYINLHFW